MTSQVIEMRRLIENLLTSVEGINAAVAERAVSEERRVVSAGEAAQARVMEFTDRAMTVNDFISSLGSSRVEQSAADTAARTDSEAARIEQSAADSQVRVADVAQMSADVSVSMAANASDRVDMAKIWREGLEALRGARSGTDTVEAANKQEPRVAPQTNKQEPRVAAQTSAPSESVLEPAVTAAEAPAVTWGEGRRPTRTEIYAFIADHPDGVTLVEMETHFNTPRIVLQVPVKELCERLNEVRRDESTRRYIAV